MICSFQLYYYHVQQRLRFPFSFLYFFPKLSIVRQDVPGIIPFFVSTSAMLVLTYCGYGVGVSPNSCTHLSRTSALGRHVCLIRHSVTIWMTFLLTEQNHRRLRRSATTLLHRSFAPMQWRNCLLDVA